MSTKRHPVTLTARMLFACLMALALLLQPLQPAAKAWKPTSHVYFAEIALEDALDDGMVTIYRVDHAVGAITGEVGTYAVDPATLAALRSNLPQYRAGVLGPDAYPDMLTGQQVIHPGEAATGIQGGADAWLHQIWDQATAPGSGTPATRAFATGFLTHAMGDMFGHTFVNYFTGGEFAVTPPEGPQNAIKHMVLEGYVDKRIDGGRLTAASFDASVAGLERFLYTNMVDARPGTVLDTRLLREGGGGTDYSIPRMFSTLRVQLEEDIDAYDETIEWYDDEIADCGWLDFSCSKVRLRLEKLTYMAEIEYKEAWRDDIDEGLRAWPAVSHEVAKALFFNRARTTDIPRAQEVLSDYTAGHLASMAGAPDAVGAVAIAVADVIEAVTPDFLLEPIRQLKDDLLDALLLQAFGMTQEQLAGYLTAPDKYFDDVMTDGAGELVTLEEFNRDYLHLADTGYDDPGEAFDYRQVPAAYNTVTMSKLILLAPEEVDRLVRDLGGDALLSELNIMLGFMDTLDGNSQWLRGMVLARECGLYRQLFMAQPGEQAMPGCGEDAGEVVPVATTPPPTATPAPTPVPSRTVTLSGAMELKDDEVSDDLYRTYDVNFAVTLRPGETQQWAFERCLGGEVRGEIAVTVTLHMDQSARAQGTVKLFEGSSCSTDDLEEQTSFTIQAAPDGTASNWRQKLENDEFASDDYADVILSLTVD